LNIADSTVALRCDWWCGGSRSPASAGVSLLQRAAFPQA